MNKAATIVALQAIATDLRAKRIDAQCAAHRFRQVVAQSLVAQEVVIAAERKYRKRKPGQTIREVFGAQS